MTKLGIDLLISAARFLRNRLSQQLYKQNKFFEVILIAFREKQRVLKKQ
jgi:hypothetical protein